MGPRNYSSTGALLRLAHFCRMSWVPDVRVLDVQRLDIQVLDVCESLVPVFQGARCPLVPFVPVFDVCEPYSNLITSESVILSLLLLQLPHALLLQLLLTEISIQPNQPTPSLLLIAVFSNSLNKPPLSSTKHKLCYFLTFLCLLPIVHTLCHQPALKPFAPTQIV